MLHYIKADLCRLMSRVPRILLIIAGNLVLVGIIAYRYCTNWSAFQLSDGAATYFQIIAPILFGLIELSAVYGDDFRAKTMQVAIGIGVSRPMVVLAKLLEVVITAVLDLLVALAITYAAGGILGAGLVAEQCGDILVYAFTGLLYIVCLAGIAMIPMFYAQSANLGILLYLLCAIRLVPALLGGLLTMGPLASYRLDNYLVFAQIDQLGAYMLTRTVNVSVAAGILIHLVLFYLIAILLFRKRELEF